MSLPMIARRKAGEPEHHIVQITPALAEKWLGNNPQNRNLRRSKVDQYARDMANGDWLFNGDPIRFDVTGSLLDGQHRLQAILASGMTVRALVVSNLPAETQNTMDIGAARKMSDQLGLAGEGSSNLLAAVLRRVVAYKNGSRTTSGGTKGAPTHAEMFAYLEDYPTVRRSAEVASLARRYVKVAPSALGMTYHLCAEIDRLAADHFYVRQLIEGIGMTTTDPARILSRKLAEMSERRGEASSDDAIRYIFLAWNAFRAGKQLSKLQGPKGGWTPSNFPHPR